MPQNLSNHWLIITSDNIHTFHTGKTLGPPFINRGPVAQPTKKYGVWKVGSVGSLHLKMVKFMPFGCFFDVTTFFSDTCGKLLFEILEVKESFPTFFFFSFWKLSIFCQIFFNPKTWMIQQSFRKEFGRHEAAENSTSDWDGFPPSKNLVLFFGCFGKVI